MTQSAESRTIRILIAGGEDLYRDLLRIVLSRLPGFDVVGAFPHGAALEAAPGLRPDVALLDLGPRDAEDGVQTALGLRRKIPELGLVLLSDHEEADYLSTVPREVTDGWSHLQKRSVSDVETLARAIEGAAAGFTVLHARASRGRRSQPRAGGILARLSSRQLEILRLIALGLSNAAIAERLTLAEKSVENQVSLLYQHLGIDRRGGAMHPRVKATLLYLREIEGRTAQERISA